VKHKPIAALLVIVAVISAAWYAFLFYSLHKYETPECKQRGAALAARLDKLKQDAREDLKIGTKKDEAIRFFSGHELRVRFSAGEAIGTLQVKGCSPSGCGTDDAILSLRVNVDVAGTVISEPTVVSMYADCL